MIPLKHEATMKSIPFVTIGVIAFCTFVFFRGPSFMPSSGLVPVDLLYGVFHPAEGFVSAAAALAASFFIHGGLFHLCANMWYLWIFGAAVEGRVGSLPFAGMYCFCGIVSMLIQAASSPLSKIPIIGASGAIAGIMGLHLLLLPFAKITCFVPPIFFPRVPAIIFLLLWFFLQYINLRASGVSVTNVAWWAHIGGYLAGAVVGIALVTMNKRFRTGVNKQ